MRRGALLLVYGGKATRLAWLYVSCERDGYIFNNVLERERVTEKGEGCREGGRGTSQFVVYYFCNVLLLT